jgi:sirohydrochlorin cobaltochelatase
LKAVVVLAMHGVPPTDFPRAEMSEFFRLHGRLEHSHGDWPERPAMQARHDELEAQMRAWPRTAENDPFYVGSYELALQLSRATGWEVIVGFNEFCGPSVDVALEQAAAQHPDKILVITPMMTSGGEHSEHDIPNAIRRAQERYPAIPMVYAWPFPDEAVAAFLAGQLQRHA